LITLKRQKEATQDPRHLLSRRIFKMRSSSSMRTASHRDGASVAARSTRGEKAAKAAPRASPLRQIVHVIDETSGAASVSRRGSLLAAAGALISTLSVSTFNAGPAEALGWVIWAGRFEGRSCCRWTNPNLDFCLFFFGNRSQPLTFGASKSLSLFSLSLSLSFSLSLSRHPTTTAITASRRR